MTTITVKIVRTGRRAAAVKNRPLPSGRCLSLPPTGVCVREIDQGDLAAAAALPDVQVLVVPVPKAAPPSVVQKAKPVPKAKPAKKAKPEVK